MTQPVDTVSVVRRHVQFYVNGGVSRATARTVACDALELVLDAVLVDPVTVERENQQTQKPARSFRPGFQVFECCVVYAK